MSWKVDKSDIIVQFQGVNSHYAPEIKSLSAKFDLGTLSLNLHRYGDSFVDLGTLPIYTGFYIDMGTPISKST